MAAVITGRRISYLQEMTANSSVLLNVSVTVPLIALEGIISF